MDFFTIALFILFIILRTMGDRRRGMDNKPVRKQPPSTPRRAVPREIPGEMRPVRWPEPVEVGAQPEPESVQGWSPPAPESSFEGYEPTFTERTTTEPLEGEEERAQAALSKPSRKGRKDKDRGNPEEELCPAAGDETGFGLTREDLRRAVIWSEILQKPRFRKRAGRF